MRRLVRPELPATTQSELAAEQKHVNDSRDSSEFDVTKLWENARKRKTGPLPVVLATLQSMAGLRESCMYCADAPGTDIEHFWPKTPFPERAFTWPNLLLGCAPCGRHKSSKFPRDDAGFPLLINPTVEDPWEFLDFDPRTGCLTARFESSGLESVKGKETVDCLHLSTREAVAARYKISDDRLRRLVQDALDNPVKRDALPAELHNLDDHGLLGWYFRGSGIHEAPFLTLRERHPSVWELCKKMS